MISVVPFDLPDPPNAPEVLYTPPAGFDGFDSFEFGGRDDVPVGVVDDTATATINITEPPALAVDQEITTNQNEAVQFTLGAVPGGVAKSLLAKVLPSSDIAGNVSATDGITGDGKNNLPGPAPVLIAAGVDVNLGSGSPQTFTDQATFLAELSSPTTYNFEQPVFPAASANIFDTEGTIDGIAFDGRIGFAVSPPPPSGDQFMRGNDPCCYTGPGFIGFDGLLPNLPDAVGFFTGFGAISNRAPFVRIGVFLGNETEEVFFVEQTGGAGVYFGFIDADLEILGVSLEGYESDLVTPAVQQFGIDDLTIGTATGGGGISGVARTQIEWDISSLLASNVGNAVVELTTEKGTVDDLDTFFFVGTADQDELLDVSDFQALASPPSGVVMPVIPGTPTGQEGTFTIDVTDELLEAIDQGFNVFSIQGRVTESLVGGSFRRGLQIHSTATGNLVLGKEPQLVITAPVIPQPIIWEIITLPPANEGTITDLNGVAVTLGQTFTAAPTLVFTPFIGFAGTTGLTYEVTEGPVLDTAMIDFTVIVNQDCIIVGRAPNCAPDL